MKLIGNLNFKSKYFLITLAGIILLATFIYWPSFQNYFSQDDFYLFKISQAKNLHEFFNFFSFNRPYTFYRPLSTEVYFFVNHTLFGMNPLPFRLVSFGFFAGSTILTALITKRLTKNETVSILTAFFYGVSAIHFGGLFWSSAYQMICVAFFYLLAFYCYLLFRASKKLIIFVFSILSFCLALLSMELAITLPLILIIYEALFLERIEKSTTIRASIRVLPFVLILLIYTSFHLLSHQLPLAETYQVNLSIKPVLGNLRWYILWSVGLPEMLIDYIGPGLKINPNLIKFYFFPVLVTLVWFLVFSLLTLISLFLILKNKIIFFKDKFFWFSIFWFVITILPVVAFQWHKFTYYLTIALFGFSFLMGVLLVKLMKTKYKFTKALLIFILLVFFLGNFNTIKFTYRTSWMVNRAKLAKFILENLKKDHPDLPKNSVIYFLNDPSSPNINEQWGFSSNQANVALSGPNAIQVLYNNPEIRVYYEDISAPPNDIKKENIITIVAPAQVK